MSEDLQSLLEKINREGVEKARAEADKIIADAKAKAADIVKTAQAEAAKSKADAEKAAREALHGITGAFLTPAEASECAWAMQSWHAGGRTDDQLENILNKHASTRERLPLRAMDALYGRIFDITGKPARSFDMTEDELAAYFRRLRSDRRGSVVSGAGNHFDRLRQTELRRDFRFQRPDTVETLK